MYGISTFPNFYGYFLFVTLQENIKPQKSFGKILKEIYFQSLFPNNRSENQDDDTHERTTNLACLDNQKKKLVPTESLLQDFNIKV